MENILTKLSKKIIEKPDVFLTNIVFFKKCLSISSVFLDKENVAYDLSNNFFDNLLKKVDSINAEDFIKLTNIYYERIIKKLNLNFLDILSNDNKKKCIELLENIEPIPKENIKKEINFYISSLKIFANHSTLVIHLFHHLILLKMQIKMKN